MANIIKRVWNQNRMVQIEDLKGMTFQAEAAGHTFQISGIDDDGNTVVLTGTPSGVLLRPDNTDVALTCSVSGGVVSATLPANCYDVPGRFGLTIFITSGSSKTAIYAAVGTVTRTSSGTVAPGTSQSVVDLINAINAAINSIPASYSALLADIAPTYSDSALYSVGQYAWYDGDLKRCIVPITTAESYTAAHWTSAVLGQDVSDLKSALREDEKMFFNLAEFATVGAYIKADGTEKSSNTYLTTNYIPVKNGDSIRYKICHAAVLPVISFYTEENASSFVAASSVDGKSGYTEGIYQVSADGFIRFTRLKASVGNFAVFSNEIPDYIGATKEDIEIEFNSTFSLLGETVQNGYIDASGVFTSGNNYRTTDYIPIKSGQVIKYRLSHALEGLPIIAFYAVKDESRFVAVNSVNGVNGYSTGTYTASADGYIKFVYQKNRTLIYAAFNESIPDNAANVIEETNHELLKTSFSLKKYFSVHAYLKDDGTYKTNNSYDLTDYIPIKNGESVKYHIGLASGQPFICFYDLMKICDTSKNVVSAGGYNDGTFTADSDGFIRICNNNISFAESYAVMDEIPDTVFEAFGERHIAQKLFVGKKIANFGDSITGNKRPPNDISTRLSELTGATAYNLGFGGCRMAKHNGYWDAFSMYRLAYAIVNNDFTLQDDALAEGHRPQDMPSYFEETLALLKTLDFSQIDIITIAYGTNDFTGGVLLDNENNKLDTDTFDGALRYSIETLLTAFPNLKIFLCTPIYRFWMNGSYEFVDDSDTHEDDTSHLKLTQFVDAEKGVGQEYHIKVIDNYYTICMNKFSRTYWFPGTDGTHPNNNGTKLIADHIASELF